MSNTVESWMAGRGPAVRQICVELRRIVLHGDPDLTESIKWGNPTYEKKGKICYLATTGDYANLGFFNVAALKDPQGQIEGTGKKMRHIKVRSLGDIDAKQFAAWVTEAVAIDELDT